MTIIILAAGRGQRLHEEIPKALLKCKNGQTLLTNTLEKIQRSLSDKKVRIVIGFKHQMIIEELEASAPLFPELRIERILNQEFDRGVIFSLGLGLKCLDEDVVIMNGDTYYHKNVFKSINEVDDSTLFVKEKPDSIDSVKVLSQQLTLSQVGKSLTDYTYISMGCLFLRNHHQQMLQSFLPHMLNVENPEKFLWHDILNVLTKNGERIFLKPMCSDLSYEIDSPEDYLIFRESEAYD